MLIASRAATATRRRGDGGDAGGAGAALEEGAFADHGSGAELGEGVAVHVDADHAVQDQVELVARVALAGELGVLLEVADRRACVALHDVLRQLALELALHRDDQCLAVVVRPRCAYAEGVRHPAALVGQPALQHDPPVGSVDPVPREGARAGQLDVAAAVGAQRHREGGPHERRLPTHVRRVRHRPRQRHTRAPADRLPEAHRPVGALGLALQDGHRGRPERGPDPADLHRRRAHHQAAGVVVARIHDATVLDLGPHGQHVGEPELVVPAQLVHLLGSLDPVGERRVPVREPQVHPRLQRSLEGVGRDPGHCQCGRLDAHIAHLRRSTLPMLELIRAGSQPQRTERTTARAFCWPND